MAGEGLDPSLIAAASMAATSPRAMAKRTVDVWRTFAIRADQRKADLVTNPLNRVC
jgi:hypothetical protein